MPYVSVALGPDLSGRLAFVRLFDRDPRGEAAQVANPVTGGWTTPGEDFDQEALPLTETPSGSGTYVLEDAPVLAPAGVTHFEVRMAPFGSPAVEPADEVVWIGFVSGAATTYGDPVVSVTWTGTTEQADAITVRIPETFVAVVVIGPDGAGFDSLSPVGGVRTPAGAEADFRLMKDEDGNGRLELATADLDPGTYLWSVYSQTRGQYLATGRVVVEPALTDG